MKNRTKNVVKKINCRLLLTDVLLTINKSENRNKRILIVEKMKSALVLKLDINNTKSIVNRIVNK